MKLIDLYYRVLGTTGLDVMDLNSLHAAVANCMADLTSRGYKFLKELHYGDLQNIKISDNMIVADAPDDIRKSVFLRLYFDQDAKLATRVSLSNPRVQCRYINGEFRSYLEENQAIYYIKNDKIYIEWHNNLRPTVNELSFGYYQKLKCPENFPTNPDDAMNMENVIINIRPEFEDAIVLYAAYFYYARYVKDTDKINLYLSNYKYYVEDIIHELSYEDEFNEEDGIIKVEEEDY
jgi:hypothetical protein